MPQPVEYVRNFSFTDFSAATPAAQQPGAQIDAELDDIKTTTDEIRTNLALIQDDDGSLKNGVVDTTSLSPAVLALINAGGGDGIAYEPGVGIDIDELTIGLDAILDQRILGNVSGATAAPTPLTPAQVKTALSLEQVENKSSAMVRSEITSLNVTTALGGTPLLKSGGTMTGAIVLAADPTAALHPATKQYVDATATGISVKDMVACATTANITLSGEQTIDGVLTSTSRVLVKNQTAAEENGIYDSAAGAWSRVGDLNAWDEAVGAYVYVAAGTTNANSGWVTQVAAGGTLGTTAMPWAQFSAAGSYSAGTGIDLTGSTFSLDIAGDTGSQQVGIKMAPTGAVSQSLYALARQHGVIAPETFGAAGDGTTDDTTALQTFLDALGDGYTGELGPKPYKFTSGLTISNNLTTIQGKGHVSRLLYGGGSTTIDLITIGDAGSETRNLLLQDFRIDSNTVMTDGAAIHAYNLARSRLPGITYGGQDGTGKLHDGAYMQGFDYVYMTDVDMYGSGVGIKASCRHNPSFAYGAGLFIRGGKIGGMGEHGMHYGGGCGGVYVDDLDIISHGQVTTLCSGILVDNALYAVQNREFFIKSGVTIDGGQNAYGITLNDSLIGTGWFDFRGWIASNQKVGFRVIDFGSATVQLNGGTIYNNSQDGLWVMDATRVLVNGTDFRNNGGYGVNAPATTILTAPQFNANASGEVTGGATWREGWPRSSTSYPLVSGSNYGWNFDANDYLLFTPSTSNLEWYKGGALSSTL